MRTTVDLPEDVLEVARSIARDEGISLGAALAKLVRRGLAPRESSGGRSGFPTFRVPADAPPLTSEVVREADDDA